jgi:hypothetical protein
MNYEHPSMLPPTGAHHLRDLSNAMEYNAAGQPVVRVTTSPGRATNDGGRDAFGRLRIATPLTLFDSQQRYTRRDDLFATQIVGTGSDVVYNINQSLSELVVGTASGCKVTRESLRVFAYQPGKSLQTLVTFVMDQGQTNLTQRVGYFNDQNGLYFANIDGVNCFVKRSYVNGSVQETIVEQNDWNIDKLDGTTASGITLDTTKAQIFFMDIEWLGVGIVRMGFVIDGNYILCHSFNHANEIDTTYMTTACLPIRYQIENTGTTVASSTMKMVCATVISEGGYQLRGRQRAVGRPVTAPMNFPTAGTFYPVVSIKLKNTSLDAIAVIKNISMLGIANNGKMQYKLVANATISGGSWVEDVGEHVAYNITANTMSGGHTLTTGYVGINNQSGQTIDLATGDFDYQLERDGLSNTAITYTLAVAAAADNDDAIGSIDWEEIF